MNLLIPLSRPFELINKVNVLEKLSIKFSIQTQTESKLWEVGLFFVNNAS